MDMNSTDRRLIVDANYFRTRVALLENGRAAEIYMESRSKEGLIGNIYKGRVQRVLPGMAAAFIDIGLGRNVFLGMSDAIAPVGENEERSDLKEENDENFDEEQRKTSKPKREKPIIKNGQTVMVQISKEAFGTKSERASMQLSLPGHTLVFMPTDNFIGISKRITDEDERKRLRKIASECCPDGTGVIMRTAASEYDEETIKTELNSLIEKWNLICASYVTAKTPSLLYHEESLITRTVRDLMKRDIRRLIVNDRLQYEELMNIAEETDPALCARIELRAGERNLFEALGIEEQIDAALSRKVWLKSGAYLIIDQTEAFITIDVNTGRKVGSADINRTIVETNVEAAAEIARQLRLRNLGGMIIVDFIDMGNRRDRETVIAALKEAVKQDRIHSVIIDMTELGLVVITRKKQRANLSAALQTDCPYCGGTGKALSAEAVALKLRESVLQRFYHYDIKDMLVVANPKVIKLAETYYNDEKKINETLSGTSITWKADPYKHIEEFTVRNNV